MVVSKIKLYELLKAKIGEQDAEAFIQILEDDVKSKQLARPSVVPIDVDISQLTNRLLITIDKAKVEIIKWRIATSVAIIGLIVAFLKLV